MKRNAKPFGLLALAIVILSLLCIAASAADSGALLGDVNGDSMVNSNDAIYLLRHTLLPGEYPVSQSADFDQSGTVDADDAIYLLKHTLTPGEYPLTSPCVPAEAVIENKIDATCERDGSYDEVIYCSVCSEELSRETVTIPKLGGQHLPRQNYTVTNDSRYPFRISGTQITSTNKAHSSSSTYTITAQDAFVLELEYLVSSEDAYDRLLISHNSSIHTVASGTSKTTFTSLSISMKAGDKVKITYAKDDMDSRGSDCAKVKIKTKEYPVIEKNHIAATCTTDGQYDKVVPCRRCGGDFSRETVKLTKLGHSSKTVEENRVEATCTTDGHYDNVVYCGRCDEELSREAKTITKLGHSSQAAIEENRVEPTCIDGRYDKVVYCKRCDIEISRKTMSIPSVGIHNVLQGRCESCGEAESSSGLQYSQNPDGTYTVTGIGTCTDVDVVIGIYNNRSVTGIGNSAFSGCSSLTSITIPDSVTSIGSSAFYGCSSLTYTTYDNAKYLGNPQSPYLYLASITNTSITSCDIHSDTKFIGSSAFDDCSKLFSIIIPDSVTSIGDYAFDGCSSLTEASIGNSVTSIGKAAFRYCSSLISVTIPEGAASIGEVAFAYCSSLKKATIPNSITSIGEYAFYGCSKLTYTYDTYVKPIDLTLIYSAKHLGNSQNPYLYLAELTTNLITECHIDSKTKIIGAHAFSNCSKLISVTIPDSVTSIGSSAFKYCSLKGLTIGDGVTSIGDSAFSGCSNLTYVTIGNSVKSIGDSAFYGCRNLTKLYITDRSAWCNVSLSSASSAPFYYSGKGTLCLKNDTLLTEFVVPDGVTSISNYAFYGCSNITSVTIPDSVTSIGTSAFEKCSSLASLTIPFVGASKNAIGDEASFGYIFGDIPSTLIEVTITGGKLPYRAFYNCSNLRGITLGNGVTSIGDYAFCGCSDLLGVTIGSGVTSIGDYAFRACSSLKNIKYRGTQAQWKAISKGDYWNPGTGSYTIIYNCTGE